MTCKTIVTVIFSFYFSASVNLVFGQLTVKDDQGTPIMTVENSGEVGIGTSTPDYTIHVNRTETGDPASFIGTQHSTSDPNTYIWIKDADSSPAAEWGIVARQNGDFAIHQRGVGSDFVIRQSGTTEVSKLRITDGTQGAGKVLVSDAGGLASWQSVSPSGNYYVKAGHSLKDNEKSLTPDTWGDLGELTVSQTGTYYVSSICQIGCEVTSNRNMQVSMALFDGGSAFGTYATETFYGTYNTAEKGNFRNLKSSDILNLVGGRTYQLKGYISGGDRWHRALRWSVSAIKLD